MRKFGLLLLATLLCLSMGTCAYAASYQVVDDRGMDAYEEDGRLLARLDARFPQIVGLPDTQLMDRINHSIQDYIRLEGGYDGVCEAALGDYSANPAQCTITIFELLVRAQPLCQSDQLLSVLYEFSAFTGGAHPDKWSSVQHYSLQTGELVLVEEMVSDVSAFHALVADQLLSLVNASQLAKDRMLFDWYEDAVRDWHLDQAAVDQEGLLVFFNPYEMAPYAAGTLYFTLPFSEVDDCFNDLGRELIGR